MIDTQLGELWSVMFLESVTLNGGKSFHFLPRHFLQWCVYLTSEHALKHVYGWLLSLTTASGHLGDLVKCPV